MAKFVDKGYPLFCELILEPAQLAAIGCVAVESASLDGRVEKLLPFACNMEPELLSAFVNDTAPIGAKFAILRAVTLHKLSNDALKKEFSLLADRITDLLAKRNIVTHGDWEHSLTLKDFGGQKIEPKSDSVAVRRHQPKSKMKASEVMKTARQISKASVELLVFYEENLGYVPSQ